MITQLCLEHGRFTTVMNLQLVIPRLGMDYKGVQYVCVYQAEPTSEETAHTWVFVHAPRGGDLPLPDMLIFDYFENYPFVAIL